MEHRRAAPLILMAALSALAPADAGYVRRSAARALQQAEAPPAEVADHRQTLPVDLWQLISRTPEHAAMVREPKSNSNSSQATASKDAAEQAQPIAMQVPQEELDKLSAKLSAGCEERFSAILRGKGPALSDFGGPHGNNATSAGCQKLNGSLCTTKANVMHMRSAPNGRKMRSTLEAQGQGCLPSECLDKSDLQVLASFMQLKARELVPGTGVEVELHVDCSSSGGSVAAVGQDAEQRTEDKAPVSSLEHQKSAMPKTEALRSACRGHVVSGLTLLVALLVQARSAS
uniref:Uncharacterized protein n=1 Tax=Alexandrium catenella TaxID=2925 RepID=A0A7S1MCK3_ALECA